MGERHPPEKPIRIILCDADWKILQSACFGLQIYMCHLFDPLRYPGCHLGKTLLPGRSPIRRSRCCFFDLVTIADLRVEQTDKVILLITGPFGEHLPGGIFKTDLGFGDGLQFVFTRSFEVKLNKKRRMGGRMPIPVTEDYANQEHADQQYSQKDLFFSRIKKFALWITKLSLYPWAQRKTKATFGVRVAFVFDICYPFLILSNESRVSLPAR